MRCANKSGTVKIKVATFNRDAYEVGVDSYSNIYLFQWTDFDGKHAANPANQRIQVGSANIGQRFLQRADVIASSPVKDLDRCRGVVIEASCER